MYANYTPIEELERPDPNLYRDPQNDVNNKIEWELVHYANSADLKSGGLHSGLFYIMERPDTQIILPLSTKKG